jgi:hypothetical protein
MGRSVLRTWGPRLGASDAKAALLLGAHVWGRLHRLPKCAPRRGTSGSEAPSLVLEIVRLGMPRLGTWGGSKNQDLMKKYFGPQWPLGLVSWGVLHCNMTGASSPSLCSAELFRRPILRAIGAKLFSIRIIVFCVPHVPRLGIPSLTISNLVSRGGTFWDGRASYKSST